MIENIDLVIIGAGLSGCVIAERAAKILNWKVLIIEKRNHIAGNCYDRTMENGIMIHQYGPHYFRTNSSQLVDYLSAFTSWIEGNYVVKSLYNSELYPFPINLDTLEQFFRLLLDPDKAKELLEFKRDKIEHPQNSEELVLSRVGREMYEAFYKNYTLKQWGKHPRELAASVCGRIPVRFNRDHRYVDHKFQIMPEQGYTAMVQKMIDHPNIQVLLNTDYQDIDIDSYTCKAIVYTGAIDAYFNYSLGKLPWRSLHFEFKEFDHEFIQPCGVINYPNDYDFIRTTETKHITGQKHDKTVVMYEYPSATGEPYYPVPAVENQKQYEQYKVLADIETRDKNVYFAGRLARYAYLNMDEVIEQSLDLFELIKSHNIEK